MYFEIIDDKHFIIRLNSSYKKINENNKNDIIKSLLILLKKRYAYNILGFYEVNIYNSSNMFSYILFTKINNSDGIYNNIDLKINLHRKDLFLNIDDYEIIKENYIKCSDINNEDIYKICEHYTVVKPNLHS